MLRHHRLAIVPKCYRGLEECATVIYHALAVAPAMCLSVLIMLFKLMP